MDRLTKLCNKYGTDKGTTCGSAHGFSCFYEPFFRGLENPAILEIGTGNGAFEKAVSDYYDGECTVCCVDINDCSTMFKGYKNIHFVQGDCGTENGIRDIMASLPAIEFDIVIDDASHFWEHQLLSLLYFRRMVKNGGYFIMEDLHSSYDEFYRNSLYVNISPLTMLTQLLPCSYFDSGKNNEILNSISECFFYNRKNDVRAKAEGVDFAKSATAVLKIVR